MSRVRRPYESYTPLDTNGVRLQLGDPVVSTELYRPPETVLGVVVDFHEKNLIYVRHDTGSDAGQIWRCAAFLWRLDKTRPREEIEE